MQNIEYVHINLEIAFRMKIKWRPHKMERIRNQTPIECNSRLIEKRFHDSLLNDIILAARFDSELSIPKQVSSQSKQILQETDESIGLQISIKTLNEFIFN